MTEPKKVFLRVWGWTADDADRAEQSARRWAEGLGHDVAGVEPATGSPCTIPRRDATAIRQGDAFNRAWAAYRAPVES